MDQSRLLDEAWRAYFGSGAAERRRQKQQRYNELNAQYGATVAWSRVQVEFYSAMRLVLPVRGMDDFREFLEGVGFYFEKWELVYWKTLFPEGWELIPSSVMPDEAGIAYLTGPDGTAYARFVYDPDDKAQLRPL